MYFFADTAAQTILAMLGVNPKIKPLEDDECLVGIVATNQSRKDFGLGLETCSILAQNHNVRLWIHTDSLEGNWSLPSLLVDYGLLEKTVISLGQIPDDAMASAYSACDITLGIGPEGFGYPLLESQFCGTPVVHGSYAGGADIVPKEWQVDPVAFRYEGSYACKRPVYNAVDLAKRANELIGQRCNHFGQYEWNENWKNWEAWFREGIK
jgi:glycosyltransferase involved in cell wall biosynthesis